MSVAGIIVGKSFITAMVNGATQTITDQHPNYDRIREAVKTKDYDAVERLINISKAVNNYAAGKVRVDNGQVFYGDSALHGAVVDRILDMIREGFDAQPMLRFLENLMSNPSKRAVDELYLWLESTKMPITEDGHFLAYKKVDENYRDFYTGKMDNSVGQILEMPRNAVDDERDRTCSYGLHFCSLSYLPHYHGGKGRVMIVKINPADVVSIPSDYDNAKGRTCRYEVIGEHTSEVTEFYTRPVYSDSQQDDDEFEIEIDEVRQQGYAAGYNDCMEGAEYDDFYSGDLQDAYQEGYAEGWDDAGNERDELDQAAYDEGYTRGFDDRTNKRARDPAPRTYRTTAYEVPYAEGYADGWDEAWDEDDAAPEPTKPSITVNTAAANRGGRSNATRTGLEGYNQGRSDAAAGRRYDANPKRDGQAYADGYAKGWDYYKQGR